MKMVTKTVQKIVATKNRVIEFMFISNPGIHGCSKERNCMKAKVWI